MTKPDGPSHPGESVGAVIVAAGRSQRLGQDKLFVELAGRPVLAWTLAAFEGCEEIFAVALVLNESNASAGESLVRQFGFAKVRSICLGGARRQDSVLAGLRALERSDYVAVHDGARPLVTPELIERGVAAGRAVGAAIPGIPVNDTVKIVGPDGLVASTPDRSCLRAIQTPQVFRRDLLLAAYEASTIEVTDDASLLEALGYRVAVYPGAADNLKITTSDDLALAEAFLARRLGERRWLPR